VLNLRYQKATLEDLELLVTVRCRVLRAANLLPENQSCEQLSLFDAAEDIQKRDRQHKLDQTVDALRQKFGDQSVVFAHSVKKKDKTDKK